MSPIVVNFTAPGDIPSQACTMFAPVDDSVLEGTHSLTLIISGTSVPTATIGTPNSIVLIITDNEGIAIEFKEFFYIF